MTEDQLSIFTMNYPEVTNSSSNNACPERDPGIITSMGTSTDLPNLASHSNKDNDLQTGTPAIFKSPICGFSNQLKTRDKPEDLCGLDMAKKSSYLSPDGYGQIQYPHWQQSDPGDIRHQLLVQRTFSSLDDHPEPRTSSPLRKIRICTVASGIQTVTVSPSSGTLPHGSRNSAMSTLEVQDIFKTPNRNQPHHREAVTEIGISHPLTPSMLSPTSTPSYGFTPGRQFFNPFELDLDHMGMSIYSPNMFRVTESASKTTNKESFWSLENGALIKPVDIKEAEIRFQHQCQQRIDRERDAKLQSAINNFFSNEVIVPSPWSEKVNHVLPRTPGTVRSVSSQTVMSVPPADDLFATLNDKYLLPNYMTEPSPGSDSFGNSFIRRKLLNQLNDNDSQLFGSPSLPTRVVEEMTESPSPIKQTTPEWEKNTPNKAGSGHFSSSPIRQVTGDKGHNALSESDLLASPELSPVAGQLTKSARTSEILYSDQDDGSPRAVMQLDFSSILDDPDDDCVDVNDKTETQMERGLSEQGHVKSVTKPEALSTSCDQQYLVSSLSHDSDGNSTNSKLGTGHFHRSYLASTTETLAIMPQSQSSQDTGYQTSSLQANHDSASNSNATFQDAVTLQLSSHETALNFPVSFSSEMFTNVKQANECISKLVPEDAKEWNHKSNKSLDADGSFLRFAFESTKEKSSSADDVAMLKKRDETCRVRKVRTLTDMRHFKEKSSVSRDLIRSFNQGEDKSNSNTPIHDSWLESNSDNFAPVFRKIINQSSTDQHTSLDPVSYFKYSRSAAHSSPDDNDNAQGVPNDFDVSMRSTNSVNSSMEKNVLKVSNIINLEKFNSSGKQEHGAEQNVKFSQEDGNRLKEARILLERSEKFRKRLAQTKMLESDSLYQVISRNVENEDPITAHNFLLPLKVSRPHTPSFKLEADCSTPTSRMLDSVKEKINQVEGSQLGSEIAAEILKRASEDLAQLTSLLRCDKK